MVTSIAVMEYTSDGYNLQHFYYCSGFCLYPCIGCMHRLMSTAGCNQLGQQFYIQLPRLETAKPKPEFSLHPIILLKNDAKLFHHSEFYIIARLLKRLWYTFTSGYCCWKLSNALQFHLSKSTSLESFRKSDFSIYQVL